MELTYLIDEKLFLSSLHSSYSVYQSTKWPQNTVMCRTDPKPSANLSLSQCKLIEENKDVFITGLMDIDTIMKEGQGRHVKPMKVGIALPSVPSRSVRFGDFYSIIRVRYFLFIKIKCHPGLVWKNTYSISGVCPSLQGTFPWLISKRIFLHLKCGPLSPCLAFA